MRNVDRAQTTITREFSLDGEDSALSRLKRELVQLLELHNKANASFQEEVKLALGSLHARREEAAAWVVRLESGARPGGVPAGCQSRTAARGRPMR